MTIACECERCHQRFQVADDLAGKRGRCKQCGHIFKIPAAAGPTAAEIYELEADSQPRSHLAEPPLSGRSGKEKKKAQAKPSGLFGLYALPPWGFNVYRGAIVALLAIALITGGVPKFILAMAGVVLCVWPFVAAGFAYRFGIAFRDGPIAGLLYMFFVPYRIHYRLTHQKLFQTLRAPTLTLRDFSLLLLGLCFLPLVIAAAPEMDKLRRNRPPEIDWTQFVGQPGKNIGPPVPVPKHSVRPPRLGLARPPIRKNRSAKPVPADALATERDAPGSLASRTAAKAPSSRVADSENRAVERKPRRPEIAGPPRVDHDVHRPFLPRPSNPAASSEFAPESTVTITVHGLMDPEVREKWNKAIIEILKASGNNWRVSFNTAGGDTIFRACPVTDPIAFADKIDFGKVTGVQGRSIDVEVEASP